MCGKDGSEKVVVGCEGIVGRIIRIRRSPKKGTRLTSCMTIRRLWQEVPRGSN